MSYGAAYTRRDLPRLRRELQEAEWDLDYRRGDASLLRQRIGELESTIAEIKGHGR